MKLISQSSSVSKFAFMHLGYISAAPYTIVNNYDATMMISVLISIFFGSVMVYVLKTKYFINSMYCKLRKGLLITLCFTTSLLFGGVYNYTQNTFKYNEIYSSQISRIYSSLQGYLNSAVYDYIRERIQGDNLVGLNDIEYDDLIENIKKREYGGNMNEFDLQLIEGFKYRIIVHIDGENKVEVMTLFDKKNDIEVFLENEELVGHEIEEQIKVHKILEKENSKLIMDILLSDKLTIHKNIMYILILINIAIIAIYVYKFNMKQNKKSSS